MKKVLVIAYGFPPIAGIGPIRSVKFAKYLPEFGWDPIVLTVEGGEGFIYDPSLEAMLLEKVKIYRARSWEPFKTTQAKRIADRLEKSGSRHRVVHQRIIALLKSSYFSLYVPDNKIGWLPFAVKLGKEIIECERIDLIFSTSPPPTNLLVGRSLKHYCNKPLVIDYRDEWTTNRYRDISSNPLTSLINRHLERSVLSAVDAVVTATQPIVDNLQKARLLSPSTFHSTIMNGFDPDDYHKDCRPQKNSKFSIVYTGSFYGKRQTPHCFLRAIKRLLQTHQDIRGKIQVFFVGNMHEKQIALINELSLEDVVQVCGLVPYRLAIEYQLSADVLLLIVGKGQGSNVVSTGKIFDYFGAGKPILALVPTNGVASDLISGSCTGITVDPEDIEAISQAIFKLYTGWADGQVHYEPDMSVVNQYSRRMLTGKLAQVFDDVLK
jgi:glycosyltransferase involved in cell wall biosynthesis